MRRDVGKLVWEKNCALLENLEVFLERHSATKCNLRFCDKCNYLNNSASKYRNHIWGHLFTRKYIA